MGIEAQLDLIGIVTADMAASLNFYRGLGVDIPAGADTEPHVEVTLANGVRLAWDTDQTIRSFHPSWSPGAGGRLGLAFLLSDPGSVDSAYTDMVAAGATGELEPFDAFWGQRYAVLRDPDGNTVDLFAALGVSANS
ncbi:VOC family protein [Pseudonocardia spinosispora]|uniref:VOC family protein n=1 Tax=Pseudonocardia spinosispora TaxID=103441 RepID=UPI00048D1672|nr:VOC family protein [Pseudonocardia spinosispora]